MDLTQYDLLFELNWLRGVTLEPFTLNEHMVLLNALQSGLPRVVRHVSRDLLILSNIRNEPEWIKHVHEVYFNQLLGQIEQNILENKITTEAYEQFKKLAEEYFKKDNPTVEEFKQFQAQAKNSIKVLQKHFRKQSHVLASLGKALLVIFSLGIILFGSAVKSKAQTGKFTSRLFQTADEQKLEQVQDVLDMKHSRL